MKPFDAEAAKQRVQPVAMNSCQCKMQLTFKDDLIISECMLCGSVTMQTKPFTIQTPKLELVPIVDKTAISH